MQTEQLLASGSAAYNKPMIGLLKRIFGAVLPFILSLSVKKSYGCLSEP